ncbi:MAG: transposase [Desertimonas sp.]
MPRHPRVDWAGAVHHVMNRGVDRAAIFFGDEDRIEFGRRLAACHEQFGLSTLAYCLMDNHYHLVVRSPTGDLSAAMQHLGTSYVRHTNDRLGRDGPMFRGRFTSIPVTTESYLRQVVRYVHLNPLDLNGVSQPHSYRWSSYRAYLGYRRPPPFLDISPVLDLFGGDPDRLAAYTTDDSARRAITPINADELRNVVRTELTAAGHGGRERVVLTALLERGCDPCLATLLEEALAFPSANARAMALSRSRGRRGRDQTVDRLVERLLLGMRAA